jgi:hypothetical protein
MSNQKSRKIPSTREINYKHKTYSLLRVPVVFYNISKFALIDTGACASFISDEYLASIPDEAVVKIMENTTKRIFRSASGESMRITGVYELKIKLSPKCEVNQIFYVLPNLEEECILGIDLMHTNEISLDVFNKKMMLGTRHERKSNNHRNKWRNDRSSPIQNSLCLYRPLLKKYTGHNARRENNRS